MKTTFKIFAAALLGGALAAGAQAQEPAGSISELLSRVQRDVGEASAENQRRLSEFQAATSRQQALLNQARNELSQLQARGRQLTNDYNENDVDIATLRDELSERQGAFNELFGEARRTAGEVAAAIDRSLISSQYPERTAALRNLAESDVLPTRGELDEIWKRWTEEMIFQQQVVRFQAPVSGFNGGQPIDVVRIGPFTAVRDFQGVGFLRYSEVTDQATWQLNALERQPPANLVAGARNLANADEGQIVSAAIDPTQGGLLEIYKDVPNLQERIAQGGIVGRIIIGVLAISASFGLFRLFTLLMTSMAVGAQKRRSTPGKSNPLGRVMLAFENTSSNSLTVKELALDAAILKETPKLDFGLNFMKLAAGIAPLLGLLGTVTGMIRVFTQITLFGTGDAQIMAGGISEALVTTVLGLISAIPLLFIHSFAQSFARGVAQTLEEQAAGILARHAEEREG